MWRFVGEATDRLEDLTDEVTHAEGILLEVLKYYGEDEKTMTSSEFYGIFKTFVTSYRVNPIQPIGFLCLFMTKFPCFIRNAKRRTKPQGRNNSLQRSADKLLTNLEQH
jgi:hypothetical protein